jgi:two-component system sensor histidine kinase GlrK
MRLSIFSRLVIGYLTIFLLVVAMSGYAIVRIGQFNRVTQSVLMTNNRILGHANRLTDNLLSQIRYERKFIITKDEAFHIQFLQLQSDFQRLLEQLSAITDSSQLGQYLEHIKKSHKYYLTLFQEEVTALKTSQGHFPGWYSQEREKATDAIIDDLAQFKAHTQQNTTEKIEKLYEAGIEARRMAIGMTGAFLVLGIAIAFFINRSITRPMAVMKQKTAEIARGIFREDLNILSPPEIKDLANALNGMCNKLNELDRMKSDFFSSMSHELRTPLATIKMGAGLLRDGIEGPVTDHQKKLLTILEQETERLIRLVNSLLDLSKMEAGMMTYFFEQRSVTPLIHEVVRELEPLMEAKKIVLEMEVPEELPLVKLDYERILQALRNLIGNAVKFAPHGGQVSILTRPVDGGVEVSVSDTGPGIPPENLATIFDKFHQVPSQVPNHIQGTGLGLAITRQIITDHGGNIWAESEPGCGSKFIFVLPP